MWKECTVNEAFADGMDVKPQDLEDGMTLISDLTETPSFLSRLLEGKLTTPAPPPS